MKKTLILTIALLAISTSLFAIVFDMPASGGEATGTNSTFIVEAKASESDLGLLLKYGPNELDATLVGEATVIKSDTAVDWDVFGANQETKNFYFFTTGRAAAGQPVTVNASIGTFLLSDGSQAGFDSLVQPVIVPNAVAPAYSSAQAAFEINIPAVSSSKYANKYFRIFWNGKSASTTATAPAGTYTALVTLNVTDGITTTP